MNYLKHDPHVTHKSDDKKQSLYSTEQVEPKYLDLVWSRGYALLIASTCVSKANNSKPQQYESKLRRFLCDLTVIIGWEGHQTKSLWCLLKKTKKSLWKCLLDANMCWILHLVTSYHCVWSSHMNNLRCVLSELGIMLTNWQGQFDYNELTARVIYLPAI